MVQPLGAEECDDVQFSGVGSCYFFHNPEEGLSGIALMERGRKIQVVARKPQVHKINIPVQLPIAWYIPSLKVCHFELT